MNFSLGEEQVTKLLLWKKEQDAKVIIEQKGTARECQGGYGQPVPYYGAIHDDSYTFTPTSIGVLVSCVNNHTKEKIDLTGDL
jgi:hypothetical protein